MFLPGKSHGQRSLEATVHRITKSWTSLKQLSIHATSLVPQLVKNPPAMWETQVWSLGWEDPLEKGKVTHSSILAWRISWTTHDWVTFTSALTFIPEVLLPVYQPSFSGEEHKNSGNKNAVNPRPPPPRDPPNLGIEPLSLMSLALASGFFTTSTTWEVPYIIHTNTIKWVPFHFSRGSSQPRDWTQVSHIAGRFFTSQTTKEVQEH